MPPPPATLYPPYCFPASPTYNVWVKLSARDFHALRSEAGYDGERAACDTGTAPTLATALLPGPRELIILCCA